MWHRKEARNKLFILLNKGSKKRETFLKQNLELLLEPLALKPAKPEGHLMMYLSQLKYHRHKNKSSSFQEKLSRSCKISKANHFKLTLKQFLFLKCKIEISRFIIDKDFFTITKKKDQGENDYLKPLFVWVSNRVHLGAMINTMG